MTGRPFARFSTAAACRFLLAALLLILAGSAWAPAAAKDEATYVTSGELLDRALDALFEKMGRRPKVAMLLVEPTLITVLTQGADQPHHADEWTISRFKYLWFDSDSVSGPAPHQSDGVVPEAENSFFKLAAANIGKLEGIVRRAIDYAKMEDRPSVVSLRISRTIRTIPERVYGAVEWQIVLSSGRENATVHCDARGRITGGDLSGTLRARNIDFFGQDDFPAKAVETQFDAAIGEGTIVREVSISRTGIEVRAKHPTSPVLLRSYSWDYSGIRHSPAEIPDPLTAGAARFEPFALEETRLAAFASIKLAARRAFASEGAVITSIVARKPPAGGHEPIVSWRIDFLEADGSGGHVEIGADGGVREVVRPKVAEK